MFLWITILQQQTAKTDNYEIVCVHVRISNTEPLIFSLYL